MGGVVLAAVLSVFAPPEASLGAVYRVIFFHGGLAIATLGAFLLTAAVAAFALARPSRKADALTAAGQETAALAFVLYFVSSVVSMRFAWGGILWQEPRFQAAVSILFVGGAAFLASLIWEHRLVRAAAALATGAFALFAIARAGLTFHPGAPIRNSGVLVAQVFYWAILAAFVLSVAGFWTLRYAAWLRHHGAATSEEASGD